jgi:hypothetical protein
MRPERSERYERRVVMAHRQDEVPVVAHKCCSFASKGMPDESSVRVRTWEGSAMGRFC